MSVQVNPVSQSGVWGPGANLGSGHGRATCFQQVGEPEGTRGRGQPSPCSSSERKQPTPRPFALVRQVPGFPDPPCPHPGLPFLDPRMFVSRRTCFSDPKLYPVPVLSFPVRGLDVPRQSPDP